MFSFSTFLLLFFSILLSFNDLKSHRISNRSLIIFFVLLILNTLTSQKLVSGFVSGFLFLAFFTLIHLVGRALPINLSIGFGDVKLLAVIAFGYIDAGIQSLETFFLSLWCAVLLQICLNYLHKRTLPSSMPMAPSIFLAVGLYLYAPIGLLLPQ